MASSSKNINMPLIFAVSIGACVSLVAIVMFSLAWYEYEAKVVLHDQVLVAPTHTETYDKTLAQQQENLGDIDKAMREIAAQHADHASHDTP